MPKEIQEINKFNTGTIMNPSSRDIPIDAARYSKNIDAVSEDGKLKGIPADKKLLADGTWAEYASSEAVLAVDMDSEPAIINNDGQYDIIYFDKDSTEIKNITDLYEKNGSIATASMGSGLGNSEYYVEMEVNNKEAHIAMGPASTDYPRWAGYIEHKQFGTATTTLTLEDARLTNPSAFPNIYQFVEATFDGVRYLYGIEWQGKSVYQFNWVDKTFVKKSLEIFTSTQGISLNSDGSSLFVLDVDSTSVVHSVDLNEMVSEFDVQITHKANYSDMLYVGSTLWFSWMGNYNENFTDNLLVGNCAGSNFTSSTTGIQTVTDRQPFNGNETDADDVGDWVDDASSTEMDGMLVEFRSPRWNLVDVGNDDYCGITTEVQKDGSPSTAVYFRKDSGTGASVGIRVKTVVQCIYKGNTAGTKLGGIGSGGILLHLVNTNSYDLQATGNDIMHSATGRQGGKYIITIGDDANDTDVTQVYHYTMPDMDSKSNGDSLGGKTLAPDVDVPSAAVFDHGSSSISLFAGKGGGRWAHATNLTSVSIAQEADVSLSFTKTVTDYGTPGSGTTFVSGERKGFPTGHTCFYKVSFMYDGYQEGPLSDDFRVRTTADLSITAGNGINVQINIRNLASFNKRISHINLYRADATTEDATVKENGFYRLVDQISLKSGWASVTDSADNPTWGNYRTKTIPDKNEAGASFEARTGITEALLNFTPNYKYSTQLNNQLFVADCYHPDLGEKFSNFMFKSKPYNFDQFDVSMDLLRLPTKPTAIKAFQGRIYAFSENTIYKIEPNSFYIEDTLEGIGCLSKASICVTDYGMCFADDKNIYLHDGRRPVPIGDAILRTSDSAVDNTNVSWYKRQDKNPSIVFDAERGSFLVFFKGGDANFYVWAYNMARRRWDLYDTVGWKNGTVFAGPKNEILFAGSSVQILIHYMGSTSNQRDWHYETKNISLGSDTQKKMFYKVKSQKDSNVVLKYQKNGTGSWLALQDPDSERILSTDKKFESIAIKAYTSSNPKEELDSLGIVFRRLSVK